jgi:hypothetical protein
MKKILLSASIMLFGSFTFAQNAPKVELASAGAVASNPTPPPTTSLKIENMYFKESLHDFGTIQEGPTAEHEFEFVNTGKEPIVISNVSASCGCTTPSYSKDPVLPGKKGTVKAIYNTQGRVAPFTKTISITSNAGLKVLTIRGEVEKAPSGSVPENNSMIKTN